MNLPLLFKVFNYSIPLSRCVDRRQSRTPTSTLQASTQTTWQRPHSSDVSPTTPGTIQFSKAGRLAGGHPSRQHHRRQTTRLSPQRTTTYSSLPLVRANQPRGLLNIGNSCFMNATLQCHLALRQHNEISTSTAIPTIMYTGDDHPLINQLHKWHAPPLTTLETLLLQVTTDKRWQYGSQQDAAEFLTWLHDNQLRTSPRPECHDVRWVAYCDECFSNPIRDQRLSTWLLLPDQGDTIQTCIDQHGGPLELTCCDHAVRSTNRQQQSYGPTLWVQINRSVGGAKNTKYIYPNMVLSVGNHTYELVGIVEHVGTHVHEGHYLAYVNHHGSWFKCDDQVVTPLPNLSLLTPQVYLAVYKQTTRHPMQLHAAAQQHHFAQVVAMSIAAAAPSHTAAGNPSPVGVEGIDRNRLIVTDITEIDTLTRVIPQPEHVLVPMAVGAQPTHPLLLEIPFRNWTIASASMVNKWGRKLSFNTLNLILDTHGHHQTWLRFFLRHHLPHLVREGWLKLGAMVCLPRSQTVCTLLTAEWSHLRLLLEEALPTVRAAYMRLSPHDSASIHTTYNHDTAIWLIVRNPRTLAPTRQVSFRTAQPTSTVMPEELTASQVVTGSSEDGRLSIHTTLSRITDLLTGEELLRLRSLSTPMDELVQLLSRDQHTHYALRLHLTPNEIQGYGSGTPALGHCALLATHQLYERHKGDSSAVIAAAYPVALDLMHPLGRARYLQWLEELSAASTPEAQETLQCIRLHLQRNPRCASLPFELWYSGRHIAMNRLHFPLTMWQHDHLTQGTCQLTHCSQIPHIRQSEHSLAHLQQAMSTSGNLLFANNHYCPLPDFEFGEQLLTSAFHDLVNNVVHSLRQERGRHITEVLTIGSSSQDATLHAAASSDDQPGAVLPPAPQLPPANATATLREALTRQGNGPSLYPPDRHGRLYPSSEHLRAIQHLSALSVVKDAPLFGGKGLFAPNHDVPKGQWIGTYTGLILDRASALTDTYLMQVKVDGQLLTIDGTPTTHENTDFTKIARINEFIWHAGDMDANVWLTPTLDAYTSVVVKRGQQYFLNYGDSYNWRPLIHRRNLPLLRIVLRQLGQYIPADYRTSLNELITQLKRWSIEEMEQAYHGTSRNHALVAYVAYGHLKCFQRHLHHFADTTCFDDWLEMTLTNEVVYRNIAFRHAYHPSKKYHYDLTIVKHRAATYETANKQRPVRQATVHIRSPVSETDLLTHTTLAPYPRPTWVRRVFITPEPTHHQRNAHSPIVEQPLVLSPSLPPTGESMSASTTPTYVQYRPHGSQSYTAPPIVAELPPDDFLHLHPGTSTQGDQHITGHISQLVTSLARTSTAATVNDPCAAEISSVANSTSTATTAVLCYPQLEDPLPPASQTTPSSRNAVSRFTGDTQVLSPQQGGEGVNESATSVSSNPPPPPHPPPTATPTPTPEHIAAEVQRLNHLADHYAPVYRSTKEYERWVNTYIHNIGGLTQAKQVDIGNTILAKKSRRGHSIRHTYHAS